MSNQRITLQQFSFWRSRREHEKGLDYGRLSLNSLGNVTDASGNPIDVGDWLKEKIEAVVKSLVGARNYTELSIKLTAANRIYQAGMNIIDNVTDLIDTSMDLDEYTGENISRIGNALRASGVVSFDAYDEMLEDLDHRKFSKWLRRLEQAEDATDDIYSNRCLSFNNSNQR